MPYEQWFAVTAAGDSEPLRTQSAAWKRLNDMKVAGRVDRVSDLNDPGRITVAYRDAEGIWTAGPGAQGPSRDEDLE